MKITFILALIFSSINLFAGETFKSIHVKDLETLLSTKTAKVFIFDANTESTRSKVGIIPGAQLLPSASDYKVETLLPKEKNASLVFYCANEQCTASHTAAERAMKAGYKDVSVMVDGIYGWKDAGKTMAKPAQKM